MAAGELLLLPLAAGAVAQVWNPPPYRRWPLLTLGMVLAVALGRLMIALDPALLDWLARDRRMLASGQVWRAVTAPFVQDSDAVGMAFNLFWLIVLGAVAERRLTRAQWLAVYFGGGIVTEFLALAWQPHGSGNSIAFCALAGALCSDGRAGRWRWWRVGVGLIGAVGAAMLLGNHDIHGIAWFAGMTIGAALLLRAPPRVDHLIDQAENVVIFGPGTDTLQ